MQAKIFELHTSTNFATQFSTHSLPNKCTERKYTLGRSNQKEFIVAGKRMYKIASFQGKLLAKRCVLSISPYIGWSTHKNVCVQIFMLSFLNKHSHKRLQKLQGGTWEWKSQKWRENKMVKESCMVHWNTSGQLIVCALKPQHGSLQWFSGGGCRKKQLPQAQNC